MAAQIQGGQNTDQFEVFFQRADLDRDGRISGAEAVAFFQGSNLPKQVLAQIWMHADQSRTGFLSRPEFYNALKLVTVAQSKRELTADIVKAALYGPASAKIPAPQINLAAIPAPQLNPLASASVSQMGAVVPTASQNLGFRGQVTPSASMNQQYFPSQVNQSIRPSIQMPTGTVSRPPQGVSSLDPRGGSMVSPGLPNSSTSSDWLGGRTDGVLTGATSQIPNRGIGLSMPQVVLKPEDPLSTSSLVAAKDPKTSTGSGNGFSYNSMFGGDIFSATQSVPQQTPSMSAYTASSASASSAVVPVSIVTQSLPKLAPTSVYGASSVSAASAIVPVSTSPQSLVNPDPFESLQSSFSVPSTGGQPQQTQSLLKPNQQVSVQSAGSFSSSGKSVELGNSTSNQSQLPWPKMTRAGVQKYTKVFMEVDTDRDGRITGEQARNLFLSWRLPREILKQVWDLSDQDNDSMLSLREFCIALYLMERYREGCELPPALPNSVMLDETLLSLAGPPTASYGSAGWGVASGFRPHQGMPGSQPIMPPGLRPQMQPPHPQADQSMQYNRQMRMPSAENAHVNQLSNGEQNSLDLKEEEEKEKKVEDNKNVLLDSKEKIEFYRTKMQDLVLYKSRCDNRLNEITERALADKREAESLGKKYEEKYKQVAEIASKLTIEEASFREIQVRKMELQQALVKMEQGGSADGILQVRADRIQSDLEELLRALTERCKKHGINVKSTALIELPPGWQPGIPEVSAIWDEDWDKFEEAGFSFDVAVPATTKSTSPTEEISSPTASVSPDLLSNADGKSEKTFPKGERSLESESAYTHSEDESTRSPIGSPARQTAFESPSKEYSDNHFRKSFEGDTETHSFDEPAWGTFGNNDDNDSVWGLNSINVKGSDHEKHGEKDFFESSNMGLSPVRTDSPDSGNITQRKSLFFEDSVPATPLSRAGNSPRYSVGSRDPFFDNVSTYDSFGVHDREFSPRRETLTRFDSVSSSRGFDHNRGFSFDDSDPFGSSGPFKVSSDSQTPKKGSENWNTF